MKLTGNLKKQVEKAETKEEKKSLIENAGMLLDDEELETVSGGKSKGEEYHGMPMSEYGLVLDVLDHQPFWKIICIVEVEITGARVQAHINRINTMVNPIAPGRRVRIEPEGSNIWRIVEVLN